MLKVIFKTGTQHSLKNTQVKMFCELQQKVEQSKHTFKKWITSPHSTTFASFVAAQEIVRRG